MEDMGKTEKERVAAQRKKLGEDGLSNLGKLLEKATKENEVITISDNSGMCLCMMLRFVVDSASVLKNFVPQ